MVKKKENRRRRPIYTSFGGYQRPREYLPPVFLLRAPRYQILIGLSSKRRRKSGRSDRPNPERPQHRAAPPEREATRRYAEGLDWQPTTALQIELFQ